MSVVTDSCDNIVIAGFLSSETTIIPITAIAYNINKTNGKNISANNSQNAFITKYDPNGILIWGLKIEGVLSNYPLAISSDAVGNIYLIGSFTGTETTNSAAVSIYNTNDQLVSQITNTSGTNSFLIKFDKQGNFQWSVLFTGTSGYQVIAGYVISDAIGDVYVTGYYTTMPTFSTTVGSDASLTTTINTSNAFIVKYNSNGALSWVTDITSTDSTIGTGVAISPDNSIVVVGSYIGSELVFNTTSGSSLTLNNGVGTSAYIAKYSSSGQIIWATTITNIANNSTVAVAVDKNGNINIKGGYISIPTINNTKNVPSSLVLNSNMTTNIFIVQYDPYGIGTWASSLSASIPTINGGIVVDHNNNIIIIGSFSNTMTTYSSDSVTGTPVISSGGLDSFILKYNHLGKISWVAKQGGTSDDIGIGINVDNFNNIIGTGSYNSSQITIFNADNSTIFSLANSGATDAFIVKYGDYLQTLLLQPSCIPNKTKTIVLNIHNNINTIISSMSEILKDQCGRCVAALLLIKEGAVITLVWQGKFWSMIYSQGVDFIYA